MTRRRDCTPTEIYYTLCGRDKKRTVIHYYRYRRRMVHQHVGVARENKNE